MADGQEKFATLYRAHHSRIVRLCRLLLQYPPEAEEVAQDVFLKLLKTESVWDHTIPLESWLTCFAVNACRDRRRSRWWRGRRETPQEFEETDFPSPYPTPEQVSVSSEQRARIWQEFRTLSPRQQEVFALRYIEGRTGEEVAELLGVTTGSVKQHLFRAVQHMRKALGGHI